MHLNQTFCSQGPFEYGIPDEKLEQIRKNKPGTVPSFERSKEPRSLPLVVSFFLISTQFS